MGLETAHPEALERLNKRMTVDDFAGAAERCAIAGVALRVFLLVSPPFVPRDEQDDWLLRSIDVAFALRRVGRLADPDAPGNGAMEALAADGAFRRRRLDDLERSLDARRWHALPARGRASSSISGTCERFADCAALLRGAARRACTR